MQIEARRFDTAAPVRVSIEHAKIVRCEPLTTDSPDRLPWVAPGLVDIQTNGYRGQEFSSSELTVEKVAAIASRYAALGVTAYCPTVTTNGFEPLAHAMQTLADAAESASPAEPRIAGIHLEGPYISPEDGPRGAHPLQHCRPPDWDEFQRLQEAARGRLRILTLSPEYDAAPEFIRKVVDSGVLVAIGHTSADSRQIAAAVDAGARLSTHLGNGAHRSLRRHPNYIWDQLAEDRLAASLIVDGHHLPPEVVQTFVRAKSPQRCVLVSDLSGWAGLKPGHYETGLGTLEILDDGRLVIAGQRQLLAGAARPLGDGIANVIAFAQLDLGTAVSMATTQPAELIDAPVGGLSEGSLADLVLFDLAALPDGPANDVVSGRFSVRATIVGGSIIYGAVTPAAA
ncbi:MAG: amidohydrolase family protein [Pirellulales bacterium]